MRFSLVLFTIKANAAVFALLALWMFGVHILLSGYVQSKGFLTWGTVASVVCLLNLLTLRGLRAQKSWAWLLATLFALANIWLGIMCAVSFSDVVQANQMSKLAGAAAAVFYFFLSGILLLLGLYLGKGPEQDQTNSKNSDDTTTGENTDGS